MHSSLKKKLKDKGWLEIFRSFPEFDSLMETVGREYTDYEVTPKPSFIFRVFTTTHINDIKVVILGQDLSSVYESATGMAFAAKTGKPSSPALRNILREVEEEFSCDLNPSKVTLDAWVAQGVFLLNTDLTTRVNQAGAHRGIWAKFISHVIRTISDNKNPKAFLLWGNHSVLFRKFIDRDKNLILESGSPARKTVHLFKGNNHFLKTNKFLSSDIGGNQTVIDWTAIDLIDLKSEVILPTWSTKDEYRERTSKSRY